MQRIAGFTIEKKTAKWHGSISIKSNFKKCSNYVTSSKESFVDAFQDIIDRYKHVVVEGLNLDMIKELV